MNVSLDATVIVCSYNRADILPKCCEAILSSDYPSEQWELLIIDNASTDNTFEVATTVADQNKGRVRVLEERKVGLSAARNTGIQHARGKLIAFTDDDAFPDPNWLTALVGILSMDDVYAAGGPVDPLFAGSLPEWFSDCYLPYLTAFDKGPEIIPLRYNEYPRGANMAFRKEAFERFGLFDHHLGRKGKSLVSCEEIELCLRIEQAGGKILYTPQARVQHRVETARITPEWLAARFAAQGFSEAIVDWRHFGFPGLRRSFVRFLKNAREAKQLRDGGDLNFYHNQIRAFRGYIRGLIVALLFVSRYKPELGARPMAPA